MYTAIRDYTLLKHFAVEQRELLDIQLHEVTTIYFWQRKRWSLDFMENSKIFIKHLGISKRLNSD